MSETDIKRLKEVFDIDKGFEVKRNITNKPVYIDRKEYIKRPELSEEKKQQRLERHRATSLRYYHNHKPKKYEVRNEKR